MKKLKKYWWILLIVLLAVSSIKIWDLNSKITQLTKQNTPSETASPSSTKTPESTIVSSLNSPDFVEAPERNREEKYEVLNKLSVQVQINYFTNLLGSPYYINSVENHEAKEHVYVDEDYYVQAITNLNDKVYSYAITSRKKDFNPTFDMSNLFKVSLNKTPFTEWRVDPYREYPLSCYFFLGAHDPIYYFEYEYFGNPGLYHSYLVGVNNSAKFDGLPNSSEGEMRPWGTADCEKVNQDDRRNMTPNTIIVRNTLMEAELGIDNEVLGKKGPGVWYGPNNIQLRTFNE